MNGGGHVTLRILISREEGQMLFGNNESLLGMLRQQTGLLYLIPVMKQGCLAVVSVVGVKVFSTPC